MTTATKRRLPAIESSEYHKANGRDIERGQAIMSGRPDPGPLMTLEDDAGVARPESSKGVVGAATPLPGRATRNGSHGKLTHGPKRADGSSRGAVTATLSDDELIAARGVIELIPVEHLGASPYQPRIGYDEATIAELAASLKAAGRNHTDLIVRLITASAVLSARTRGRVLPKTKYEVLDGHRRLLAGQRAGLPALWCKVVELDDTAARKLCREANLNREDLKPLERLFALRDMLKDGDYATQADLAAAQGLSPAALSNQLRVLELPHEITSLISQEILGPTHLRALVPFKDKPAVITELLSLLKQSSRNHSKSDPYRPTVSDFERLIGRAIERVSRPVKSNYGETCGKHYVRTDDMPTAATIAKHKTELEVQETSLKGVGQRCFNVKLWDELQAARAKERAARTERPTKTSKAISAADKKNRDEQAAQRYQRDLYTYRIEWLQRAIVKRLKQATLPTLAWHTLAMAAGIERPSSDHHAAAWIGAMLGEAAIAAGGEQKGKHCDVWPTIKSVVEISDKTDGNDMIVKLLCETLGRWYQADLKIWRRPIDEEFVEAAAKDLGIDMAKDWKPIGEHLQDFLKLHSKEQLWALMLEWKRTPSAAAFEKLKRSQVIEQIVDSFAASKPAFPKCLAKVKPCNIAR